ncbi:hypothetical protein OQA88_9389 [Cercophora sp. LCS_1]
MSSHFLHSPIRARRERGRALSREHTEVNVRYASPVPSDKRRYTLCREFIWKSLCATAAPSASSTFWFVKFRRYKRQRRRVRANWASLLPAKTQIQVLFEDEIKIEQSFLLVDPRNPQDVTLHLSLPVRDDLEDILETCSALRRLGHFGEAIRLFDRHLEHFLDNKYVAVQYAQCLYDAGQLTKLRQFMADRDASPDEPRVGDAQDSTLRLNWDLLARLAGADLRTKKMQGNPVAGIHLLALVLDLGYDVLGDEITTLSDVYWSLCDQGMVWEFQDLLQSAVHLYGADRAMDALIDADRTWSESAPLQICQDWDDGREDESTLFALLEIFVTLALGYVKVLDAENSTKQCMDLANNFALRLLALDEGNLMTRPCLRWTMAKQLIKDDSRLRFQSNLTFRGFDWGEIRWPFTTFPTDHLPIYTPNNDEIPCFSPRPMPTESECVKTAQLVLNAAEELGDLKLQTACLQELMYRGAEAPEKAISQLRHFWSTAGDNSRVRVIDMFRYILLDGSPREQETLRRDILSGGEPEWVDERIAYFTILAALTVEPRSKSIFLEKARQLSRSNNGETITRTAGRDFEYHRHDLRDRRPGNTGHDDDWDDASVTVSKPLSKILARYAEVDRREASQDVERERLEHWRDALETSRLDHNRAIVEREKERGATITSQTPKREVATPPTAERPTVNNDEVNATPGTEEGHGVEVSNTETGTLDAPEVPQTSQSPLLLEWHDANSKGHDESNATSREAL